MRTTTLILDAIVITFFAVFLFYTFVARQNLETLARDFVTEKTLAYSRPIVAAASESLDSPLAKKLQPEAKANAIRSEIDEYEKDPMAYVADVTGKKILETPKPTLDPLLEKIAATKFQFSTFRWSSGERC